MDFYTEIINITELDSGEAVLLVNENYTAGFDEEQRSEFVKDLMTIAKNRIASDYFEAPDKLVPISIIDEYKDYVTVISISLSDVWDIGVNTYFGGKCNTETSLKDGLQHMLEILTILEENL